MVKAHFRPVGSRSQRTLAGPVSYEGVGLHSGREVVLRLQPAAENSGIHFQRLDLPDSPLLPASVEYVSETIRCTKLAREKAEVHTVEHLLAALNAYKIDNITIQLTAPEPPAAGGCALPFIELFEAAGVVEQSAEVVRYALEKPVWWREGAIFLAAFPSSEWRIDYTLHYPGVPDICTQYCSFVIDCDTFSKELAPCRTFALAEEIERLQAAGLIKGGSLENAVIIRNGKVINAGGLRFANEMARHKALDMVGDLALVARDFTAHFVAVRSGHEANVAFARCLSKHFI